MNAAIAATVQISAAPKQANRTEAVAASRRAPTNRVQHRQADQPASERGQDHRHVQHEGAPPQEGQTAGEADSLGGRGPGGLRREAVDLVGDPAESGREHVEQRRQGRQQEGGRERHLDDVRDAVRLGRIEGEAEHRRATLADMSCPGAAGHRCGWRRGCARVPGGAAYHRSPSACSPATSRNSAERNATAM